MGRKLKYNSLEEMREAQRVASRRFYAKKKEERASVPREERPIPKSYTVEYHRERYQMKKQERLMSQTGVVVVTDTE
jgi:hypothetical protein